MPLINKIIWFQVYNSLIHHLYSSCVHHSRSSLLPSLYTWPHFTLYYLALFLSPLVTTILEFTVVWVFACFVYPFAAFSCTSHEWNHIFLSYFALYILKIHQCHKWLYFHLLHNWVVFHCIYLLHLYSQSSVEGWVSFDVWGTVIMMQWTKGVHLYK